MASGNVMEELAIVEAAVSLAMRSSHPVALFVSTDAYVEVETGDPGVSVGMAMVVVARVRVMVSATVRLIVC